MSDRLERIVLNDFSGGRNQIDSPLGPNFRANQVLDAVNGDWYHTTGFRKRHGSTAVDMTSGDAISFTGTVSWLGRHVPGTSEAAAELWGIDDAVPPKFQRLTGGTTWAVVTITGTTVGHETWDFTSASLNGKFFIAFPSNSNRLHCWDPYTGTVRPTGIDPGVSPPTVANTGVGAYPATLVYVRIRYTYGAAGFNRVISEPSAAVTITPSGAGAGILVTQPAILPGENENLWYVEVSTDGATYYILTGVAIATTTYTITTLPTVFSIFELSPAVGTYTLQQPYKYIAADNNRMLGFGNYDTAGAQNRVEWSAIVGTAVNYGGAPALGADERVDTTILSYMDLDEHDSGSPTALMGPVWGNFYPFKQRQMWELAPTGSTDQPYRKTAISKELGCVGPHAVCRGEDAAGNPALYFMSHRGLYRYGETGLRYVGIGIEDYILGPTAYMNLTAANVVCHMVYHQDKRQVWVWFATGTSDDPTELFMYDVRSNNGDGAWARFTGENATARCSVMFSDAIGADMGIPLVPHLGHGTGVTKADDADAEDDRGEPFAASITTRVIEVPGYTVENGNLIVLAPTATNVILRADVTQDFGALPGTNGYADLTALDSEVAPTRVQRKFDGTRLTGSEFIQITVGDEIPIANRWSLDRIIVPILQQRST